ncbi:hypothetical protein [Numidum massiliense]|uniref:hypothetical protein n=1 Tax=Numidum massiliense TaxID=1522315 RepID=UPI0011C78FC3|nr:hypothetical protein [Numidum massiliense]
MPKRELHHAGSDLPEPRLTELMAYHYDLTVRGVRPAPHGWHLVTDRGLVTMCPVKNRKKAYWEWLDGLLAHLRQQGLTQLPHLVRTQRGKLSFSGFRGNYALWLNKEGQPCQWRDAATWSRVAQTLAAIHRASRDMSLASAPRRVLTRRNWRARWEEDLAFLTTVRTACTVVTNRTAVDRLWLNSYTYVATLLETARNYLDRLGSERDVRASLKRGTVTQRHLSRKMWVRRASGAYSYLDWDDTVVDSPVTDLAQHIHLAAGKRSVFIERLHHLLGGYETVNPLKENDWGLLYARLLYPEQLVRAVSRIYLQRGISEEDAATHLARALEEQRRREYHLRLIPSLFKDTFHRSIPEVDWLK